MSGSSAKSRQLFEQLGAVIVRVSEAGCRVGKRSPAPHNGLWPHSNNGLVPPSELLISVYVVCNVRFNSFTRGWVGFLSIQFSNPASRSA